MRRAGAAGGERVRPDRKWDPSMVDTVVKPGVSFGSGAVFSFTFFDSGGPLQMTYSNRQTDSQALCILHGKYVQEQQLMLRMSQWEGRKHATAHEYPRA